MNWSQVYRRPPILNPPSHLPPHPVCPGCTKSIAVGALLHTPNAQGLSILHMVVCMFQGYALKSSHPLLLPLSPWSFAERAPQPHIELPQEIQEDQEVTATCSLNFACHDYQIHLQWSLEGSVTTSTILSTETVATQSSLSFQPSWTHNGKNLTCQLWDPMKKQLLSEKAVLLEVKCESPRCSCGRDEGPVISSPPQRGMGAQRRKRDGSVGSRRWEWSRQSCDTSSIFPIISAGVSGYGFLLASASQVALVVKNPPGKAGDIRDAALIPGLGRSPGGGHGNPLQNSYLENPPGQRSLTGYSPWGHKELDKTKATEHAHMPNRIK